MELKEFAGSTAEEAIAKAEEHFGLGRDDLFLRIVADEKVGLLGFGLNKRAVIVARPKAEAAARARVHEPAASDLGPRREREGHPSRDRERDRGRSREPLRPTPQRDRGAAPRGEATPLFERARALLAGIVNRMGHDREFEIGGGETENAVELEVRTDSRGLLVGEGGEVLEALTYLVNRMTNKGLADSKRVVIEAEGYRSDRVASLEQLALSMAEKVRATGKPATLDPMNSYDRRIIHITLQKEPGVVTESLGEGALKSLLIRPADRS
jgi:spoIIIJ-associated protein